MHTEKNASPKTLHPVPPASPLWDIEVCTHGGRCWSGPNPKGGGYPPSPKWLYRSLGFVGARDFVLGIRQGGNFCVPPYVSVLKILRILWRIQKWLKSTKKDFDPDPASGSDPG